MKIRRNVVMPALVCLTAFSALSQGLELRVNTFTSTNQNYPAVSSDAAGNYVVVWSSSYQDGAFRTIFGQRFSNSGTPLGGEFRANPFTVEDQADQASVASDSSGNFVIVWQSFGRDGNYLGIFGQRYSSSGAPAGAGFGVNSYVQGSQSYPSVASTGPGSFVVVWQSTGSSQDGNGSGVFGRRFDGSGSPIGLDFRVNSYTTENQERAVIAPTSSGGFVVAWHSRNQDGTYWSVFAQRFDSAAVPLGPEFRVNTYNTERQRFPAIASNSTGGFVIVWQSFEQNENSYGVFGQRFAAGGAPAGGEFHANVFDQGRQGAPDVASDSTGNFVVLWDDNSRDGHGYGIFGRRYTSAGTPVGAEFRANTYTTSNQRWEAVSSDPAGHVVVVWASLGQNGSQYDIFGKRSPTCWSADQNGDFAINVSDVLYLINRLFAGGPAPACGGDVNGDLQVNVTDVLYLINFLFAGGPPPV